MFPGRAELRPGETPVAAGRAVAPGPRALCGRSRGGRLESWGPCGSWGGPGGPHRAAALLVRPQRIRTAEPLVLRKNLGGSSPCIRGARWLWPRTFAHLLRRFPGQEGPQPRPLLSDSAPGRQQTPGSPEPGQDLSWFLVWSLRVPDPAHQGPSRKPRREEVTSPIP